MAHTAQGMELLWLESQCRGCVGCGGRCSVFSAAPGAVEQLPAALLQESSALANSFPEGMEVEALVDAGELRRAAWRSYGLALLLLLLGAALGHVLGGLANRPNVGAFIGLIVGTFAAGALTKRASAGSMIRIEPAHSHPKSEALS